MGIDFFVKLIPFEIIVLYYIFSYYQNKEIIVIFYDILSFYFLFFLNLRQKKSLGVL